MVFSVLSPWGGKDVVSDEKAIQATLHAANLGEQVLACSPNSDGECKRLIGRSMKKEMKAKARQLGVYVVTAHRATEPQSLRASSAQTHAQASAKVTMVASCYTAARKVSFTDTYNHGV